MRHTKAKAAACTLALMLAGCGSRLHDERNVTVPGGGEVSLKVDAPNRDQKVHVLLSEASAPVNVSCYLKRDEQEAKKAADRHRASDKILAKQEKCQEADLDFTVPAREAAVVLISAASGKSATAKILIEGR
jgi:outer membrane lipopolysaccharide assembly protein LptE/RlpB